MGHGSDRQVRDLVRPWRPFLVVLAGLAIAACKTTTPPGAPAQPLAPALQHRGGLAQEDGAVMVREKLRVAPLEVVFSGVRGAVKDETAVAITNISPEAVQIATVRIVGDDADTFMVTELPHLPRYLAPDKSLEFRVEFAPGAQAHGGVHRARLQVLVGPQDEQGPPLDLSALVMTGREAADEPALSQVVQALGYKIDVGGETLVLGTQPEALGDEITPRLFQAVKSGNIAMDPVARFSADGPLPYGYYRTDNHGKLEHNQIGVLAAGEHQGLNPGFHQGEGQISFDPGPEPFGIYVQNNARITYSESDRNRSPTTRPSRNTGGRAKQVPAPAPHAVRVYPLKSRNGMPIPDAYLLAFEEAANGDYQDYVFILWNVRPVPSPVQ